MKMVRAYTRTVDTTCTCILLRAASRKVTALYDAALEPAGITVTQYSLLRKVRRLSGPSLTDLARESGLDRSTIGRNVRVLERLGLVSLAAGQDQREATVMLEPRGDAMIRKCEPLWEDAQKTVEEKLGPDAVATLRHVAAAL